MLQIAQAGTVTISSVGSETDITAVNNAVFYETDFNTANILSYNYVNAQTIYFYFKERSDSSGLNFLDLTNYTFTLRAYDATTGESIAGATAYNKQFVDLAYYSLSDVGQIDIYLANSEARNMVFVLTNDQTLSSVTFYIKAKLNSSNYYYLWVDNGRYDYRQTSAIASVGDISLYTTINGGYLLISPTANFSESSAADFDFSYPQLSVYYKKNNISSCPNYSFYIDNYSSPIVNSTITCHTLPNYQSIGIITFSKELFYVVSGTLFFRLNMEDVDSGNINKFYIKLYPSTGKISLKNENA